LRYLTHEYTHEFCAACEGDGFVLIECGECAGTAGCPSCKGSGRRAITGIDGQPAKCLVCGGTGRCPDCEGNGFRKTGCRACQGAGRVASERKVKETYLALLARRDRSAVIPPPVREQSLSGFLAFMDELCRRAADAGNGERREVMLAEAVRHARSTLTNTRTTVRSAVRDVKVLDRETALVTVGEFHELQFPGGEKRAIVCSSHQSFRVAIERGDARAIRPGSEFVLSGRLMFNSKPAGSADPGAGGAYPLLTVFFANPFQRLGTVVIQYCRYGIGGREYASPGVL
jgi:hypothetical protein